MSSYDKTSGGTRRTIRQDIEVLRMLSALGIVWFHSGAQGARLGYSGLIVFVMLSIVLSRNSRNTFSGQIYTRAKRLLVPWTVWVVFYGMLNLATRKPVIPLDNGLLSGLLSGPSSHLWFLPYIFFVLIAIDMLRRKVNPSALAYCGAGLAIITLLTAYAWREASLRAGYPWAQYAQAAAGVFAAVFLKGSDAVHERLRFPLLGMILLASASTIPLSGVGIPYTIGTAGVSYVLLLRMPGSVAYDISPVSQCMFGVYLFHPFLLSVANAFDVPIGFWLPSVVFVGGLLLVFCFKRMLPGIAKYAV